jgi:hypothetical protein
MELKCKCNIDNEAEKCYRVMTPDETKIILGKLCGGMNW